MRVVLDTNVFVSAVFFGGTPGQVLSHWRDRAIENAVSREILEEYVRVGERLAAQAPGVDIGPVLDLAPLPALLPSAPSAPPLTLLSATPHSPPRDLHPSPPGIQKWDIFAAEKWDIFGAD